jgi:hypothetical protein
MGFYPIAIAAIASAYQAWQFQPESYGALGNGKVVYDGAMSSSSNPTYLVCSTSTPFTTADVGKTVHVGGAGGGTYTPLITTIASYVNTSTVVLAASATSTVSGGIVAWATDDTAAFKSCLSAAVAYAAAGPGYADIVMSAKRYGIAANPIIGGATLGNAQIPLPIIAETAVKVTVTFKGVSDSSAFAGILSTVGQFPGPSLMCLNNSGTIDGTYGPSHIIGGPFDGYGGGTATFSNMQVVFDGITLIVPYNGTIGGADLFGVGECNVRTLSAFALAVPASGGAVPSMSNPGAAFSNFGVYGLRMPSANNNENSNIWVYNCEGVCEGIGISEHTTWQKIGLNYNYNAMVVYSDNGGTSHYISGNYVVIGQVVNGIFFGGSADEGSPTKINIDVLSCEGIGNYMIDDASNYGVGTIRYNVFSGSSSVNGGSGLTLTNIA